VKIYYINAVGLEEVSLPIHMEGRILQVPEGCENIGGRVDVFGLDDYIEVGTLPQGQVAEEYFGPKWSFKGHGLNRILFKLFQKVTQLLGKHKIPMSIELIILAELFQMDFRDPIRANGTEEMVDQREDALLRCFLNQYGPVQVRQAEFTYALVSCLPAKAGSTGND